MLVSGKAPEEVLGCYLDTVRNRLTTGIGWGL